MNLSKVKLHDLNKNFLNEAGEADAARIKFKKEIQDYITDLAKQFKVKGNNTAEILNNLLKVPHASYLYSAVDELKALQKVTDSKPALRLIFPKDIKIDDNTLKAPPVVSPKAGPSTTPKSTAPKSTAPKMGETVNLGKYQFTFDGKDWISPIDHKPVDASLGRALNVEFLKKKAASKKTSPKKPAPTKAAPKKPTSKKSPTPTSGIPKGGAIDVSKKYKFDTAKGLWVNIATNVPLNKSASSSKTLGYWNAVKKGTIIPEGITKLTYKEFFV